MTIKVLNDGYRYDLENGCAVEVIHLDVNGEDRIGIYFLNPANEADKQESYFGLSEEAAIALVSGIMQVFEDKENG